MLYVDDAFAETVAERPERIDDDLSVRPVAMSADACELLDDADCVVSGYRFSDADDSITSTLGFLDDAGFFVADDGTGLPDDASDLVEAGHTTGAGGTGLGLAIVERIATEHGWSVTVRDADAGRVRFEFEGVRVRVG